jgi:SAM-dependent methyltransferase
MRRIKDSRYWEQLLDNYARNPSIALCRVPELELLSQLELEGPVLDHCCGDGYIAAHAFPGRRLDAGIDLRDKALAGARSRGTYLDVQHADASRRLPYEDGRFGTIINNSAIEHIQELDQVVAEVARVLRPGGRFHFNVLNDRYFEWWPLDAGTRDDYRRFQPFIHALSEGEWRTVLLRHGFRQVEFCEYMPRETAQMLAEYDYLFSVFYLRHRPNWRVISTLLTPEGALKARWRTLFGELLWDAGPGLGAGFRVSATRGA